MSIRFILKNLSLRLDEGNQALQEFLAARNPKQQHSSTLESYLIKPIQRILKYPLLLQQLRNLTDVNSEEHLHLIGKESLKYHRFSTISELKVLTGLDSRHNVCRINYIYICLYLRTYFNWQL